jgi:hypothetical protein
MEKAMPRLNRKCLFERKAAILLHQFDSSFSQKLIESHQNHRVIAKGLMKLLPLVAASLVGSTWRMECPAQTAKVFFDPMMAIESL